MARGRQRLGGRALPDALLGGSGRRLGRRPASGSWGMRTLSDMTMREQNASSTDVGSYQGGELTKGTNWWGAFVVGLAGTILVTGVTGPVLAGAGSAGIVEFFVTVTGAILCICVAEMATMLPDRTGGCPAYAYYAFKDRFPRSCPIINGVTSWMYWLGWWPVMAVNNILIGGILATLFNVDIQHRSSSWPAPCRSRSSRSSWTSSVCSCSIHPTSASGSGPPSRPSSGSPR